MKKMKKYWKLFMDWVIGLKSNPFTWTRLKLTILYSIVIIFGIIIYIVLLHREIQRTTYSVAQEISDPARYQRFIKRSNRVTIEALYSIQAEDILMILMVIGASYFLAGLALKPIRDIMESQKQFLSHAAHELKTPLAIIKTEMEVFLRDKRSFFNNRQLLLRKRASMLSNLEEVDRMSQIIEGLLIIARIDAKQDDFIFGRINLTKLLIQSLKKIKTYANTKHIKLVFNTKKSIYLTADPDKLQQAIYNIIKNAIDYAKQDGLVHLTLEKSGGQINLTITDNGIGIPKENLPKIFQQFFRANNTSKKIAGSGLGLSIAESIIKRHRGIINIGSKLGKGTKVMIILPSS